MTFTVTGAFREGVDWLRSPVGITALAGYTLLALVAGGAVNGLSRQLLGSAAVTVVPGPVSISAPGAVLTITGLAGLGALLAGSVVLLRLAGSGQEDAFPADLWTDIGWTVGRLIVAGLLAGAAVTVGTMLFLVPGLFLLVAFAFYGFVIANGGDALDGLAKSWELTGGNRLKLFVIVLVTMVAGSALNMAAAMTSYMTVAALLHGIGVVGSLAVMGAAYRQLGGGPDGG